ncbi:MAG: germination protein YpeB [Clostridia bacterium]|nr:germination protein YpeB [Clostridia bacterium]
MKKRVKADWKTAMVFSFAVLSCLSLAGNVRQHMKCSALSAQLTMQRQRDMTDVVSAMADIEVNLEKLLIASGAMQSAELLGKTALLAQHVETGLSRLPLSAQTSLSTMRFAGQMGDYAMTLAAQVSAGRVLSAEDERQIESMLTACQGLNTYLSRAGDHLYEEPMPDAQMFGDSNEGWQESVFAGSQAMTYPSLIYDGPFSDGRTDRKPEGLTGERITRGQAKEAAARYAGTTADRVYEAADSGGAFEAFGFLAETPDGKVSVQVTGQGGHLLWMMPEEAEFEIKRSQEECLESAQRWLEEMGFEDMQRCFVQAYDGMVVANFAAQQHGVLVYPQQVKVQISMDSGAVVGAECSGYWLNRKQREEPSVRLTAAQAQQMLSERLEVRESRLCIIPDQDKERLCWEFRGTFGGETYYVYIDANTGAAADILRIALTQDGETAL